MIITYDIKGLEVVTAAFLSNCPVLRGELLAGRDLHEDNRIKFKLGDRDTSKRFKFKMIYGGTAHGFVSDPMFQHLGYKKKEWEIIIEDYFNKYCGLKSWHETLIDTALSSGTYVSPSGRTYDYKTLFEKYEAWFYIPKIKNYPVQGFGADIVAVARVELYRRMKAAKCKSLLVNTIHDSIILDCPRAEIYPQGVDKDGPIVYNIRVEIEKVFQELPRLLSEAFDIKFDLPLHVACKSLTTGEKL